jgi:hypothetical protein
MMNDELKEESNENNTGSHLGADSDSAKPTCGSPKI